MSHKKDTLEPGDRFLICDRLSSGLNTVTLLLVNKVSTHFSSANVVLVLKDMAYQHY